MQNIVLNLRLLHQVEQDLECMPVSTAAVTHTAPLTSIQFGDIMHCTQMTIVRSLSLDPEP